MPDLPEADYRVWVRGYGLVDSEPVPAERGGRVELAATVTPDAATAARIPDGFYAVMPEPRGEAIWGSNAFRYPGRRSEPGVCQNALQRRPPVLWGSARRRCRAGASCVPDDPPT